MVSGDHPARHGAIHLIDTFLFVPDKSLYEIIQSDQRLNSFRRAMYLTNATGTLLGTDRVTVFAPNDAAFSTLPAGMLNRLLLKPEGMEELIMHHIYKGVIYTGMLKESQYGVMPMRGSMLRVTKEQPDEIKINYDSSIVVRNIKGTNGVLHIIDKVLLP